MGLDEIAGQTKWDETELGHLALFVPMLGAHLPFVLFLAPGAEAKVTDKMAAIINETLDLGAADLQRVKELLWEEANFAFWVADYGVEAQPGETALQAHLREFGIRNAEDAFEKSSVREVHIIDEFNGRYAELKVNTGSENYISIIVKDGRIIDFDDDGTHLGWFDEDERYAHKKRQVVLG